MSLAQAFCPWNAGTALAPAIVFATSTTAASKQIRTITPPAGATVPQGILICNYGSDWLWLNFGQTNALTAAAVPVATNIPIVGCPPAAQISLLLDPLAQWVSAILSSGTGVCVISLGEGL